MTASRDDIWPDLPYGAWKETCATLHLWTQVVGKVRLACTPWLTHSWHVPLYVTAHGLTTSPIPYQDRAFAIDFDFTRHTLDITTSVGGRKEIALETRTVADFYALVMSALTQLGIPVRITQLPSEIPQAIPFSRDRTHRAYDAEYARRFWRVLVGADRMLKLFRTSFIGKASPVHFFWGGFDLAVTRFSGRRAPLHPGGVPGLSDAVVREAYSHEVSSAGFWPGGGEIKGAAFYAYAAPEPAGFGEAPVRPAQAFYHPQLKEFLLMYDDVRMAASPRETLLEFLQSTYEAAADLAQWDRKELERAAG
jgi:hypothetical protein